MAGKSLNSVLRNIKGGVPQIVTPRITAWLAAHPEGIQPTPEVMEKLRVILMDKLGGSRAAYFHATEKCSRREVFEFLGAPVQATYDPFLYNIFNDGTWRHLRWQVMGLLAGVFEDVEVRRRSDELRLSTSADAVNYTEAFGFELKGTSYLKGVIEEGVPLQHLTQIHRNFLLFPELERWSYLAEDKRTQQWREIVVLPDDSMLDRQRKILEDLGKSIDQRYLPPMVKECELERGPTFTSCPFSPICPDFDRDDWLQLEASQAPSTTTTKARPGKAIKTQGEGQGKNQGKKAGRGRVKLSHHKRK